MTPVLSGIVFTIIILLYTGVSVFVSYLTWNGGSLKVSIFNNVLLSELIVLLPGLLIAILCGSEVGEIFRFRKLRPGTAVLIILFILCMEPLVSAVNAFSQLFCKNVAFDMAEQIISEDSSFIYAAMVMAVLGPLAEELTFRGIIYAGLRKSGRLLSAIIIQALLFGLMHLNINQFSYSFLLGIAFGILNEVTNSLWPGLIGHFMINFESVMGTFLIKRIKPGLIEEAYSRSDIMYSMFFFSILAIVFTGIAYFILLAIARHENGGKFRLYRIFHSHDIAVIARDGSRVIVRKPHVITVPLIIGIIIASVEMVVLMLKM